MPDSPAQSWRPIADLPEEAVDWGDAEVAAMAREWAEGSARLADAPEVVQFRAELIREIAIETGVIEGLYRIDRGVTETLIRVGLIREELEQGVLDRPADEILPMLKDHESATEGLFDFVKRKRDLSTSYVKELHAQLTRHQTHTDAVTPEGDRIRIPLIRGDWKTQPTNPRREDGSVHEYCPPEHVAAEMDRLIAMHCAHEAADVAPDVAAAWLHHRFAQIHPFQDGNGRVARSLASLVFLRAGWTLVNVTRNDTGYIAALEAADAGDLQPFVRLLGRLQFEWFDRALTVLSRAESADAGRLVSERAREREGLRGAGEIAERYLKTLAPIMHGKLVSALASADLPDDIDYDVRIPGDEKRKRVPRFQQLLEPVFGEPEWELAPVRDRVFVDFHDAMRSELGFVYTEDGARRTGIVKIVPYLAADALRGGKSLYRAGRLTSERAYRDDALSLDASLARDEVLATAKAWLDDIIPFLLLEWERRR